MKTAEQIARETMQGEHWQAVDPYGVWEERRGEELRAAIVAAIEADRAQIVASLHDRPEVVPIEETVRRHAFIKGYETAIDNVRQALA